MIRKEAWSFYRTISGVRLCWELEEPQGPKGQGTAAAVLLFAKASVGFDPNDPQGTNGPGRQSPEQDPESNSSNVIPRQARPHKPQRTAAAVLLFVKASVASVHVRSFSLALNYHGLRARPRLHAWP